MKKIFLTGCAALLFTVAGMAQQQQQKSSNTQYRKDKVQRTADSTYNYADSTLDRGIDRAGQRIQGEADETGQQLRQGAERVGQEVDKATDKAGQEVKEGSQNLREGAQKIGDETREGVQRADEQLNSAGDQGENKPDSAQTGSTSSVNKNDNQATVDTTEAGVSAYHDVEVMDSKEGPNGEVVYKFNDGYYYVDRDKQNKLVKINESELKDARHKVVVKTGGKSKMKSGKSKSMKHTAAPTKASSEKSQTGGTKGKN